MKVAINKCFGGFGISQACYLRMVELGYSIPDKERKYPLNRDKYLAAADRENSFMIQAVEELGEKANATYADIHIVEIPDGAEYKIDYCDGMETIRTPLQIWG